jgi:hypothetical protein
MGTLAIFAPFGSFQIHLQFDLVLATFLRTRGFEAFGIGCDGLYPTCDVLAWAGANARNRCQTCAAQGPLSFQQFAIPLAQMRSFLTPDDPSEATSWADAVDPHGYSSATYLDKPLGNWVSSSVCSYFRTSHRRFSQPEVQKVHRQFLINAFLTYRAVRRIFESIRPTHCSIFNGRMGPYRIAFEIAKELHIPTLVHERGWSDNSFLAFDGEIAISTAPIHQAAETWKNIPLTTEEAQRVTSFFANRELGKDINIPPFVTYAAQYAEARRSLRVPSDARIFLVCTSSEYELDFCDDYATPISQLDLIKELIEIFRSRDEYLVVRHHPSIGGEPVAGPDYDFLSRSFAASDSLPRNVRIISPSEQLSSYALFWHADACFAPFSITGTEALARGIPAAGFTQSPFRDGLAMLLCDYSREKMVDLIDSLLKLSDDISIEDLRKLYRFQYTFIERLSTQFKSFGIRDHYGADIRIKSMQDLEVGRDPEFDRICRFFTDGESPYKTPSSTEKLRSPDAEGAALADQLAACKEKRLAVRQQARQLLGDFHEPEVIVINWPRNTANNAWERSLNHSRHRNWKTTDIADSSIASLLRILDDCDSPFCILRPPEAYTYDEAFISRGVDLLTSQGSERFGAVFFAALRINHAQQVVRADFSRHRPLASTADLTDSYCNLSSWNSFCATMVWRTSCARAVLSELQLLSSAGQRQSQLIKFIMSEQVQRSTDGLVYVSMN